MYTHNKIIFSDEGLNSVNKAPSLAAVMRWWDQNPGADGHKIVSPVC